MQGLVGMRTAADINLILQLLILAGLYYGFGSPAGGDSHSTPTCRPRGAARVPLIAFMMVPSFKDYIIAGGNRHSPGARLTIAHGVLGSRR